MNVNQLNILLADDDTDDCIFFKAAVDEFSVTTNLIVVHDGEQLMQLLTSGTSELPDMLFLDLNMPRKNGFECLSEIKLSHMLKNLPVIMFSTSFEQDVVNMLYESGAQYFIRKPTEFIKFKKIIQQTLSLVAMESRVPPTKDKFVLTVQNCFSI